jgi:hypothetical protein
MARPALMGASVSLAEDQSQLGRSAARVLRRGPSGEPIAIDVPEPAPAALEVVHFVELDDGRRVTTEELGEMSLHMSLDCTEAELREDVREFIFEDEMREIPECRDEPRWDDMVEALGRLGVATNEAALARLPFAIELDGRVLARVSRPGP